MEFRLMPEGVIVSYTCFTSVDSKRYELSKSCPNSGDALGLNRENVNWKQNDDVFGLDS